MRPVDGRTPSGLLLLMAIAVVITVAVAILLIQSKLWRETPVLNEHPLTPRSTQPDATGARAHITASDIALDRALPCAGFALLPGQSLDARLPSGPFKGECVVRFDPGPGIARQARIGAEFQNGSLILTRSDEPPLLSDYAGDAGRMSLTTTPVQLAHRAQEFTFTFQARKGLPARFRALWQPEDAQIPLPLPSGGAPFLADESLRGMAMAQQLGCASCHRSVNAQVQAALDVNPAPLLSDIGSRVRPEWIRRWLRDPQAMNRSATMPRQFHGEPDDDERIEDLTHFLVSMGGPIQESPGLAAPDLAAAGMLSYHSVGCVACHGPLESVEHLPGRMRPVAYLTRTYVPLGDLPSRTTAGQLSRFLRDPLKLWPSGRMPSLGLTKREADSIAAYLIGGERKASSSEAFIVDPEKANRGREHFVAMGCANCHVAESGSDAIPSSLRAAPLESLIDDAIQRGCLSESVDAKSPRFEIDAAERSALKLFLQSLPMRRSNDVPIDRLACTIVRLNCTACHSYLSEPGPEAAIAQYFTSSASVAFGDEGRLPPTLTDVGAKLQTAWLKDVLVDDARARPFMNVRMPHFGEANVGHLAADFAAAAGVWAQPDAGPECPSGYAAIGRTLIGSSALNCIQCHTFAGLKASETQGSDLATMPQRLRFEAFARWVLEPQLTRPGTTMPALFRNGGSQFTDSLDGDATRQVEAIWAYLSQAAHLPPPEILESSATQPATAPQNHADHVQEHRQEKN